MIKKSEKINKAALSIVPYKTITITVKSFSITITGKSFSEALILKSINPQYDDRLYIELPFQYMKIPSSEHVKNMLRTCCLHKLF